MKTVEFPQFKATHALQYGDYMVGPIVSCYGNDSDGLVVLYIQYGAGGYPAAIVDNIRRQLEEAVVKQRHQNKETT